MSARSGIASALGHTLRGPSQGHSRLLALLDHASLESHVEALLAMQSRWDFELEAVHDPTILVERLKRGDYDGVLLEDVATEDRVASLLPHLRQIRPDVPVLMISDAPRINRAAHATSQGAADHIVLGPQAENMLAHRMHQALSREHRNNRTSANNDVLKRLLDAAHVGLLSMDDSGTITYVNGSAARLLGREPRHLIGTPFLGPIDTEQDRLYHVRPPGAPPRSLLVRTSRVDQPKGYGYAASLSETTGAQRSFALGQTPVEARLRSLENREHATVAAFDHDGTIEGVFGTALKPVGLDSRAIRRRLQDMVLVEPRLKAALHRARSGQPALVSLQVASRDILVDIEPTKEPNGDITGGVLIALDTTGTQQASGTQTQAEQARKRALDAEELVAFKTQLLNRAAHELNTPLTPLVLNVDALASQRKGALNEEQSQILASVQRNLDRLRRAVQHMIDVEQASRGSLNLKSEPVQLAQIIRKVVASRRADAQVRQVSMTVHAEPVEVQGDATRLEEAVGHLIDNALRASDKEGLVRISSETTDGYVAVRVVDEGRGFTAAQKQTMFEALAEPSPDRSGIPSGSSLGVGLFLTRAIAAEHGGRLIGQSPGPGKGATFTIYLPRKVPDTRDAPDASDASSDHQP